MGSWGILEMFLKLKGIEVRVFFEKIEKALVPSW